MFEKLENRQMFAAQGNNPEPTPIPDDIDVLPTIHVNGTDSGDTITLSQSGNTLTAVVNGVINTYDLAGIVYVKVDGKGGADAITADASVKKGMHIWGGAGSDIIHGGSGNDWIYAGYGSSAAGAPAELYNDWVYGGAGNDILHTSYQSSGWLYGEAGDDSLNGHNGFDHLDGGANNDTLKGNAGGDYLKGGSGNDKLYGHDGVDTLEGQSGDDFVDGGEDNDFLFGGAENDTLYGGHGDLNYIWGDDGNDTFVCQGGMTEGADWFSGGLGVDTASYKARLNKVTVTLDDVANDGSAGEDDKICSDVEIVWGGAGDDELTGSSADNKFYGEAGNDTLKGLGGKDDLFGWLGDDTLIGGAGDDNLYGEQDNDTLVTIGGGTKDHSYGGGGRDNFWLDDNGTETHDADGAETNLKLVHRVASFVGGVSKEANGQEIADPNAKDVDDNFTPTYKETSPSARLFGEGAVELDEINQGGIGSCSFLAALGAVVNADPATVRSLAAELGDGSYAVRLYNSNGTASYVRVDGDLAFKGNDYEPYYAGYGNQQSMWIPIMEKALARFEGNSYDSINGMTLNHAFVRLFGANAPAVSKPNNAKDYLKNIRSALNAGKAVTIGTIGVDDAEGFVGNHAYTVVSVKADFSQITIRNPWGHDGQNTDYDGITDGYVTFTAAQFRLITDDSAAMALPSA